MSTIDQCPSTKGKIEIPESPAALATMSGKPVWRSVEEFAGDPSFGEFVQREFPASASILDDTNRRSFLKVMGASLALAGAATIPGCRRPDRKIVTYSKTVPEEVIPGRALYFATALPLPGGGAEGILVESHTGRPTKVEGNPLHPNNQGKTSAWAQASVLDLYDPDRLKYPVYDNPARGKVAATWDDFKFWAHEHFAKFDANRGRGLAFVVDKISSPTLSRMRAEVLARWPEAEWVWWNPAEQRGGIEGTRLAFGTPHRARYRFENAQRVLAVESDFTCDGPDQVFHSRGFARTRRVMKAGDGMSRLYSVESRPTPTGGMADHRFRLNPGQMAAFLGAIARELGIDAPGPAVRGIKASDIKAIAEDLASHRGHAVVVPGEGLAPEAYALAMAINAELGAVGPIVELFPLTDDMASDSAASLAALTDSLNAGRIDTVVCIDANPVYNAPAALDFATAFAKAPVRVTLSVGRSETASVSTWSLNGTHAFEAWGDVVATDGTLSVVQPQIAPLFEPAMSGIELLGFLAHHEADHISDGYALVTETWASRLGMTVDSAGFEKTWRRALHDGLLPGSQARSGRSPVRMTEVTQAFREFRHPPVPGNAALEAVFYVNRFNDGRSTNNPWLMELPEFGPSVVWDNPAYVSPQTAKSLGLLPEHTRLDEFNPYIAQQMPQARLATLTVDGREMEIAVWILPGMADNVVAIKLGYGRKEIGRAGHAAGFNTYAVKPMGMIAGGAKLERSAGTYTIASTQNHWSLAANSQADMKQSRHTIVRAMDKYWWDKYGGKVTSVEDHVYGHDSSELNIAEKIGELSHTPPNIGIYENPLNRSAKDADPTKLEYSDALNRQMPPAYSRGPQWGMSIDLNACSGCGVCTIACQSENNIPVVGKAEVAKGREMQWIRVDRYFVGEDLNNPDEMLVQPVACVHCENAPCETVCPVNATIHGPEGTNNMAYNRCIGTRYCANNCPYKVRRFNFFDYAQSQFRGGLDATYVSRGVAEAYDKHIGSNPEFNQNFIPPRLRQKVEEISKMQFNPHVTVRSRGVMEKCSYCIQRVNEVRQDVKIKGTWTEADQIAPIPDGLVQSACQQACPTDAISFGDLLDPSSRVKKERDSHRSYLLLGYLNTRPRTTYMMKVRNPNNAIRPNEHDPLDHGGHGADPAPGHGGDSHAPHLETAPGAGHGEAHSAAYIDRVKQYTDQGYSLSLRVLSAMS
ncbi:MAG: 4Fe-4S dicluster domain-containing protein [Planctomycetota bacterium]|nr:MAG: 4Fe-4S dicluster domain-containing protein [Planctomycetota bacterium]